MENSSEVTFFILAAYEDLGKIKYLCFICLLLLYLTIIFSNSILVYMIFVDRSLHEPMYLFLCSLFINELYGSTAFFPVLLLHSISETHEISRPFCILQLYCLHTYGSVEILNLACMAYDRYLSICHPLHYHRRMSYCKVCSLIVFTWLFGFMKFSIFFILQLQLPLCGNIIYKLGCNNLGVVKLACITVNNIGELFSVAMSIAPLIPVLYSYANILRVCYNSSKEAQMKALNTCGPQVISILNFCVVGFFEIAQNTFDITHVPLIILNIFTVYLLACPQLLNPIMFGVKLTKIRKAFKSRFFTNNAVQLSILPK